MCVVGDGIKFVAVDGRFPGGYASQWVVGIESIIGTHPVVASAVTENTLSLVGSGRMGFQMSICIKTIDAVTLNRTPDITIVTFTYSRDGRGKVYALGGKTPR